MRRRLAALLVLALCLLALGGCGGKTAETLPKLILRYADNQPEDYPTTQAARYFAQLVEERTNGEVVIRVYADGELGDEVSVFEQVQIGGIDLARASVGTLGQFHQAAEILQLPYLFADAAHEWRVLDGEIGDEFLALLEETGVTGLSWFDAGARNIYTTTPVSSVEDLAGMTIRVQESDMMSRMVRLWGATPVQIPYGEVYSALQTGRIDGAENNYPSYESSGHFEAAPYYLLDGHARLAEVQIISRVAMERLAQVNEDYPDILRTCARECAQYERELWKERETRSEKLVREYGCVITVPTQAEMEKFRALARPMYEGYPEKLRDLIDRILES